MKNICFVVPTGDSIGGITTWFNIITEQAGSKINIFTIDTSLKNNIYSKKIHFIRLFKQFIRSFKQKRQFNNICRNNSIDVLHIATNGGKGFYRDLKLLKAAKKRNIPTILHFHYGRFREEHSGNGIASKLCRKCCGIADYLIFINEESFEYAKKTYKNAQLIYNPISLEKYSYTANSTKYLFLGNVFKEKGIMELINAFTKFNKDNLFELLVIGPYNDDYYQTLPKNNKIRFVGKMPHDRAMNELKGARALILPSYTEGMPYCILEAMARGIPVVASKVGNINEKVGDCGFLIKPKSEDDLMEKLNLTLDETLMADLSKKSYQRIKQYFSSETIIEKLFTIWGVL